MLAGISMVLFCLASSAKAVTYCVQASKMSHRSCPIATFIVLHASRFGTPQRTCCATVKVTASLPP